MQLVDLCCGIGTFSYAAQQLGIECEYAHDKCKYAKQIYDTNHNNSMVLGDLIKLLPAQIPPHEILCCGAPCQPYSKAGLRKGMADARYSIFTKLMEIISHHKPQYVIFENVKNLYYIHKALYSGTLLHGLRALGIMSHMQSWTLPNTHVSHSTEKGCT